MTAELYIPIWLYSNGNFIFINCTFANLYIPIWLYSNVDNAIETLVFISALHSNLVIFKFKLFRLCQCCISLYIPIWLYSNIFGFNCVAPSIRLYIPIWLYSNLSKNALATSYLAFTFQSGYIQIVKKNYSVS